MADESNNITDTPYSPSRFTDQSTAPLGVLSAEQGRSTIDEVADADIQAHGKLMNDLLLQTYNSSQAHLIDVKKRLIEEKEIAMMEAERSYLNKYDQLQNEIRELRESIQEQEAEINRQRETFSILSESAATLAAKRSAKYSSPSSLSRMFRAWAEEVHSTRRSDKLDTVAKAFARKYLLAKTFLGMCLNSQKRKSGKANAESRFKFESVTTEMVRSYEAQLQALRDDLKEAYMTIEAEQLRRQQLEEDLRRLFLKNMTAMNFEALSLFQQSHNMVESVHTKPIRSTVPAATPPRPVRRDLSTPATAVRSAVKEPAAHTSSSSHHHFGGSASGQKTPTNGLSEEEAHYQARMEAVMAQQQQQYGHDDALLSPALSAPPLHAARYERTSALQDSCESQPRPALRSVGSVGSTHGGVPCRPSAGYTSQLSDAYRSATSVTSRLAHNVTPASGSPPQQQQQHNQHHQQQQRQQHMTPLNGSFHRSTHSSSEGAATWSGSSSKGHNASSVSVGGTPASGRKKPFH